MKAERIIRTESLFHYPEVIVAAVDISGMKNLMKKDDELNSATKIIGQICGNIANNPQLKIHWKQFGDSAYLIGNPSESLDIQLGKISFSVSSLTAFGLFAHEMNICDNFLLRSGISKGDLKAAQWNSQNSSGTYFIGDSMAKAYKLEESQNWFGGCIDFDIDCKNLANDFIIKYGEIPIKLNDEYKMFEGYAINWLVAAKQIINQRNININFKPNDINQHIKSISENVGYPEAIKEKIKKKLDNTNKFVEYCLK